MKNVSTTHILFPSGTQTGIGSVSSRLERPTLDYLTMSLLQSSGRSSKIESRFDPDYLQSDLALLFPSESRACLERQAVACATGASV
jgi:hypothetical protein